MFQPVFLPTSILFVGGLLEIVLARVLSRATKGWLAFLASVLALVAVFALMPAIIHGDVLTASLFDWDAGNALVYRVDGLSVLFMLLGAGMGSAILLYSVGYMEEEEEGVTRFYVLMLVFIAGFVMLACSANLLIVYFSWELIGLCSYFLVGFWYKQQVAADGARKVLIITHIAGYGLLAAIMLLYVRTGTFVWTDPAVAPAFSGGIVLMMIVAAMAKSVMYPLHTWIPEAMNAPTPVSALLHSACYVKAGAYLIARMYSIGPWHETFGNLLLVIGCVTMLVGVIFALAQTDLKRLLAFHTVSQLGYVVTGLALGTSLGVAAGLFYAASHALFKGTLFMCAGAVQRATGTRDMRKLGGLASRMPVTTLVWLVSAAAIAGVPLTNGFVAKWLLFDAALEAKQAVVVVIAWAVSVLTAFSFLKATVGVFYGIPSHELHAGGHGNNRRAVRRLRLRAATADAPRHRTGSAVYGLRLADPGDVARNCDGLGNDRGDDRRGRRAGLGGGVRRRRLSARAGAGGPGDGGRVQRRRTAASRRYARRGRFRRDGRSSLRPDLFAEPRSPLFQDLARDQGWRRRGRAFRDQ